MLTPEQQALVEDNIKLAGMAASNFMSSAAKINMSYDDCFQECCLGLMKAAASFEPDKGFAFSTYAVPVIQNQMRMILRREKSVGRKANTGCVSLDSTIITSGNDFQRDIRLEEVVLTTGDDTEDRMMSEVFISSMAEDWAADKDKVGAEIATRYLLDRHKITDIAKDLGLSQPNASRIYRKFILRYLAKQKIRSAEDI